MKNRTKLELVVFVIVAVIFLANQFTGRKTDIQETPGVTAEAQLQAPETAPQPAGTDLGNPEETEELKTIASSSSAQSAAETAQAETPAELSPETEASQEMKETGEAVIAENGTYTDRDSVALYISVYGHLPKNFITKNEARDAGWNSSEGNLPEVCPGMSIGGDRFGNYEEALPKKKGRKYFECDINYNPKKGHRGAERIVYSNDGLIYYTKDHYRSFELLYGEP